MPLPVGRTIADRFVIEAQSASGGMGSIYRAHDKRTASTVAVKLLRPGLGDPARFAREAATLASLEHPGVVRYLDHRFTGDEEPYLIMEWLEGQDLASRLEIGPDEQNGWASVVARASPMGERASASQRG